MKKKKRALQISVTALVLSVLLVCSACSALLQNVEEQASPQPTTEEEVIKRRRGDMVIAMPEGAVSLYPMTAESEDMVNLLSLIYETPLTYEVNGKLTNLLVQDWSVNEDKTVFTFTLRDGVYFTNGSKLTASDVVYSAEKVLALSGADNNTDDGPEETMEDPEQASPSPAPEDGATDESKQEEKTYRYAQYNEYVSGIKEVGDSVVELTMNKAGNWGLHFMTFPVMSEAEEGEEMPVGTGPYKLDSYSADDGLTLAINEDWWKELPYIERITAKPVAGSEQELEWMNDGMLDFATTDVLYANTYKKPTEIKVMDYMTNYYDCLIPNLLTDELQNVNVRQAVSYALDRREILSTVLLNHGVPSNLPISPDYYAFDTKYKISDYDSKLARNLLEEAGYRSSPEGEGEMLTFDLLVEDDRNAAYRKEAAKAVKKQLADVGIEVNIIEKTSEDYKKLLETGNFDLAYCSFYMDINPNLSFFFSEEGEGNFGYVSNAEITAAIEACEAAVTEEETLAAYGEIQRVLTERVPQIGLYYRMNSIVCDEGIAGITDVRQNMIFSTIADWYISYIAEVKTVEPAQQEEVLGINPSLDKAAANNNTE